MRDYAELAEALRICGNRDSDCEGCPLRGKYGFNDCAFAVDVKAADAIEELQAQRTAFWVDTQPHMDDSNYKKDGMSYYCSACGHRAGKYKHRTYKFCPWCGAKIVEKGEKDDKQYQLHC